jgi:hypothetical protein
MDHRDASRRHSCADATGHYHGGLVKRLRLDLGVFCQQVSLQD